MNFKIKDHPCRRDCPRRTAECKLTCEKFIEYEKKHMEEYERRGEIIRRQMDLSDWEFDKIQKARKKRRR